MPGNIARENLGDREDCYGDHQESEDDEAEAYYKKPHHDNITSFDLSFIIYILAITGGATSSELLTNRSPLAHKLRFFSGSVNP